MWLLRLLWVWASCAEGARLLAFLPFPVPSHQNAYSSLLHRLAERGHSVHYLTPLRPQLQHPNLTLRLVPPFTDLFKKRMNVLGLGRATKLSVPHLMGSAALDLADHFYGSPPAQDLIHGDETFDAVLMESFFLQEPVSTLGHKFGCPVIELSSLSDSAWLNELAGLPDNPAYQMDFKSRLSDDMTFWERLYNWYVTWSTVGVSYWYLWRMEGVAARYFNYSGWVSRPPLRSLVSNKSLILINRDPLVASYPFPAAPHVKSVGGINIRPSRPLPEALDELMSGEEAVVYFSLGSNLKTGEQTSGLLGSALFAALAGLPVRVLMKREAGTGPSTLPANFFTSEWFPQQDVLAHKNCKLFITHGGHLSLIEAVYHGVPVLGIPFFGDQFKNMRQVEVSGYGLSIDHDNVTTDSLAWALAELLYEPKYRREAARRSEALRDRLVSPLEEAVYWVEYVLRHPDLLRPRAASLGFLQLHQLDIYCFLLGLAILSFRLIGRN